MATGLRRYQFSERLADILGASRRDLRYRVTLLVSGGLIPPGPRGPGSPPATSGYAADLLIGVMAAPQQSDTVEAIKCYAALTPEDAATGAPGVVVGPARVDDDVLEADLLPSAVPFGAALAALIEAARAAETREAIGRRLFGVWVGRGFPVAAVQLAQWSAAGEGRGIVTRRFGLSPGARPPTWLDPEAGGAADPGLLHTVFLPGAKLIDIAGLTAADPEEERTTAMLGRDIPNLDRFADIAKLASLARGRRDSGRWDAFLDKARAARAWAEKIDKRPSRLTEVANFGANPGDLKMFTYVPEGVGPGVPLVVVLHGCTQSAASIDHGTGWSTLADRHGFAVLYPQQGRINNPLRCVNWFRHDDMQRGDGEPESIRQMVAHMIASHGIDASRVYATGVSAGGAMTAVMLATHPEVFAGGSIIAGVPYGAVEGLQDAFELIFQGREDEAPVWGGRVRGASSHSGPWPKVSVWHGDADMAVNPINAEQMLRQWTNVHGLGAAPTYETTVQGQRHRVWCGADGEPVVESYTIAGLGHGVPIDPNGAESCGNEGPFIVDAGISSTVHAARAWGLTDTVRPAAEASTTEAPQPKPGEPEAPQPKATDPETPDVEIDQPGAIIVDTTIRDEEQKRAGGESGQREQPRSRRRAGGRRGRSGGIGIGGVDVGGIIGNAFELAGIAAGSGKASGPGTIAGVDLKGILTKSFETAGLAAGVGSGARDDEPEPAADPTVPMSDLGSGWRGEDGWALDAGTAAPDGGPVVHGRASSGVDCDTGLHTSTASTALVLGERPALRYSRKLVLTAAANMLTKARFRVLVDGIVVDEVIATGMDHAEDGWSERTGIDLARFAGRTVTVTVEVGADSNVCREVAAEAWIAGLAAEDTPAH